MNDTNNHLIDDEDLEDDDDDFIFDEDLWVDSAFPMRIAEQYPNWHQMKITMFTSGTLAEIKAWCTENVTRGQWASVGWNSGCSYSVGIVIENGRDAMMYRLRWS